MRPVLHKLASLLTPCLLLSLTLFPCAGSASAQHSGATTERLSKIETSASLTATPNPVAARQGTGTTKITWRTGDNTPGEIYVSDNGGPEKFFASGADGTSEAAWISNASTYVFRLYSSGETRKLLATLEVKGNNKVVRNLDLAPLIDKAISARSQVRLVPFLFLCAGAWYVSRRGKKQLARNLLVTNAVLVTILTLFSVLTVTPRPLADQPYPDAQENADAARQLIAGNGYVTFIYGTEPLPPRYPPGFSLLLSPFAAFGEYPSNVQIGTKVFAAFYVLAAVIAAGRIGGPLAAALTALLIGLSPFARVAASLVMSDALGAAGTTLFIWLLYRPSKLSISLAGGLAGALVAIRLPLAINLIALMIVLPGKSKLRALAFASPALAAFGLYNWVTFGSPLRTGYNYWLPDLKAFAWSFAFASPPKGDGPWIVADTLHGLLMQWVCPCPVGGPQATIPNILFYPTVLLGFFWTFAPPLVTVFGLLYLWKHRGELSSKFMTCVVGLSLLLFTFYFHQGTRFMAAPATLLLVSSAIYLAQWLEPRFKAR